MKNDLIKKQELISNPIIMKKNVLRNSEYSERLERRAKGEATPKVGKILELYNLRKISQLQTAEHAIHQLISTNPKEVIKGMKLADKIIDKHREVEPLSHRLRQKTTVRVENQVIKYIKVGDDKKAKTDIKTNLHSADRKDIRSPRRFMAS